jgi:hypothetical protein
MELVTLEPRPVEPGATTQPTIESKETDASGVVTRQYDLWADRSIEYDMMARRVTVDGPGNILAQQTASATTQPAPDYDSMIGGAGNTAIAWNKRFIYDQAKSAAVIEGAVRVVHRGLGPKPESVQLSDATIIQAEFEPPAQQAPGAPPAEPKLQQVTAIGPITILTADKTIKCGEINFDPIQELLTCTPGVRDKVVVVDNNTLDNSTFDEAVLNLKTNELTRLTNVTGEGR